MVATKEEVEKARIQCDGKYCTRRAWLRDWMGWKYCFNHLKSNIFNYDRPKLRDKWFYVKTTRIFFK